MENLYRQGLELVSAQKYIDPYLSETISKTFRSGKTGLTDISRKKILDEKRKLMEQLKFYNEFFKSFKIYYLNQYSFYKIYGRIPYINYGRDAIISDDYDKVFDYYYNTYPNIIRLNDYYGLVYEFNNVIKLYKIPQINPNMNIKNLKEILDTYIYLFDNIKLWLCYKMDNNNKIINTYFFLTVDPKHIEQYFKRFDPESFKFYSYHVIPFNNIKLN